MGSETIEAGKEAATIAWRVIRRRELQLREERFDAGSTSGHLDALLKLVDVLLLVHTERGGGNERSRQHARQVAPFAPATLVGHGAATSNQQKGGDMPSYGPGPCSRSHCVDPTKKEELVGRWIRTE